MIVFSDPLLKIRWYSPNTTKVNKLIFFSAFWEDEQSNSSPLGGATIKEINLPSITDTVVFIRKFESKVLAKYVITENPLHGFISIPKKENVPLNELYLLCNY